MTITIQKQILPNIAQKEALEAFDSWEDNKGVVVLPISMGWLQEDVFTANIFITLVYATVSFLRIYYFRRIFERMGFDDNFIRLGIKAFHKISSLRFRRIKN